MKRKTNYKHYLRKTHRYMGIFIGIQFLMWTLGGLYFSWTDINEIRGDHLKNEANNLEIADDIVSASSLNSGLSPEESSAVTSVRLVTITNKTFYEVTSEPNDSSVKLILFDASTGARQKQLSKEKAEEIALTALKAPSPIARTEFLTQDDVSSHHEIRAAPLPAWAITFEKPANLIVYVSAENGQIISFRTTKWRIFDFLWMLHTMDFYGRDNINNYILRAFSIFGIATILSGFLLFGVSSKPIRRMLIKRRSGG